MIEDHPKSKQERPQVYIMDQMLLTTELLSLYRACSAFVLPTRGEGWGRHFFEATLLEMPTIGTNWSGQLEYMNEDNAYLIRVDEAKVRGRRARQELLQKYSLRKVAKYVAKEIK